VVLFHVGARGVTAEWPFLNNLQSPRTLLTRRGGRSYITARKRAEVCA